MLRDEGPQLTGKAIKRSASGGCDTRGAEREKELHKTDLSRCIPEKDSELTIHETYEKNLYNYIWTYIRNRDGLLYRIGGMPDHLHILLLLPPDYAVSDFVRDLKTLTSKYLKDNPLFPDFT